MQTTLASIHESLCRDRATSERKLAESYKMSYHTPGTRRCKASSDLAKIREIRKSQDRRRPYLTLRNSAEPETWPAVFSWLRATK
ncbi:hypothetical protein DdX_18382 [Ditylenchus destructor]|uniref:Uncharacterized protein n=1 Tax=Ditylenchus destructor TaxID=166010 RepID=A0AAD4QYB9_9BILA|nr:hypothetical protein DdX_18382 [Ditylenchus destructor]